MRLGRYRVMVLVYTRGAWFETVLPFPGLIKCLRRTSKLSVDRRLELSNAYLLISPDS